MSTTNDADGLVENLTLENINSTNPEVLNNGCSTPKGKKFRIPRINKCPPAPMKRRSSTTTMVSSVKRSPISFFSPPDLELFFFFASDHPLCVNDNTN
ncbi:hypothetical protein DCAR_0728192 [Daucus carota subsp. sativus]|uniref:Uncharacterized protein n=1 Tax=Daucus carota subsp. sativus TaxID=79200 RepID=A0AAF0XIK7_DAUCS|nr:hypothetical protein DCAR_0728192 [Daucus carota subsp. sativus]